MRIAGFNAEAALYEVGSHYREPETGIPAIVSVRPSQVEIAAQGGSSCRPGLSACLPDPSSPTGYSHHFVNADCEITAWAPCDPPDPCGPCACTWSCTRQGCSPTCTQVCTPTGVAAYSRAC